MISDASPLIIYGTINRLDLLRDVLGELVIAEAVFHEVVVRGKEINSPDAFLIEDAVNMRRIRVVALDNEHRQKAARLCRLYTQLDEGEAQTIALALQRNQKDVLIDEAIARKVARFYGLVPRGSLGVLLLAVKRGRITPTEAEELLALMLSTKLRISASVLERFHLLLRRIG